MRARRDLLPTERAALLDAPTLTLAEAAQVIGVGLTALRDAIRRDQIPLPVLSIGTRKVVPTVALRQLLGMDPGQSDLALGDEVTEARQGQMGVLEVRDR